MSTLIPCPNNSLCGTARHRTDSAQYHICMQMAQDRAKNGGGSAICTAPAPAKTALDTARGLIGGGLNEDSAEDLKDVLRSNPRLHHDNDASGLYSNLRTSDAIGNAEEGDTIKFGTFPAAWKGDRPEPHGVHEFEVVEAEDEFLTLKNDADEYVVIQKNDKFSRAYCMSFDESGLGYTTIEIMD